MAIKILPYPPGSQEKWDAFVNRSNEGTLFHRMAFLKYHGSKFMSFEHPLAWYKGEELFGVMPLSVLDTDGEKIACSPYGASYGGPVFEKPPDYLECREVVFALTEYMRHVRVTRCVLVLPVSCCYRTYSETMRLSLLEHGFQCVNRDISSVVNLSGDFPVQKRIASRARNMVRKAEKAGIFRKTRAPLKDFWAVLEKTYQKIGRKPAHTFSELQWLCSSLPDEVYVDVAYFKGVPVAGAACFVLNARVNNSFYLCQYPEFQHLQGQSLIVYHALTESQAKGFQWFDFGTSSVNMQGSENLFLFKESFGAVGLFRETYEWINK